MATNQGPAFLVRWSDIAPTGWSLNFEIRGELFFGEGARVFKTLEGAYAYAWDLAEELEEGGVSVDVQKPPEEDAPMKVMSEYELYLESLGD